MSGGGFNNLYLYMLSDAYEKTRSCAVLCIYEKELFMREKISYIICGGLTTLVNYISYVAVTYGLGCYYMIGTIIAWIVSVSFAYVTNKHYVFRYRDYSIHTVIRELKMFFSARAISGVFEIGSMYVSVSFFNFDDKIMKIIILFIVIVLNFILSKFYVFRKGAC